MGDAEDEKKVKLENINGTQSVSDLDKIISREQEIKKTGVGGYIFWGLAIPPFSTIWSIYAAYKKGVLHLLMPTMTFVYTIFFGLFSLLIFSAPKAFTDVASAKLQTETKVVHVPTLLTTGVIVLTILGLVGGFYLRSKAKKQGSLSVSHMLLLVIILALQFFVEVRELAFISSLVNQSFSGLYIGF
ncbi:hypothetical protein A2801_00855 [Candidatus Woesebacteria bacterium RIFCSPHIGHO2_01_FULL_41_10]|uniref:Uncharacterized protein n=1 Tax=Candidatus Woesebacteria bacterium RIFCSPHIGHO2_01_FULL_41_10 TaxID=1802500 RepID=A0A1F7YMF4_9BACT|nr:MAG: hypothetical protein A2801_00855 [Candidatus Woesebacteria bacterium RIFCSPHIGHO2_01_FULL_41_10]